MLSLVVINVHTTVNKRAHTHKYTHIHTHIHKRILFVAYAIIFVTILHSLLF